MGPMASALFDAQGCLTAHGFAQISAAPPGAVPGELAAHLAACPRCQRRLLATAMGSIGGPTPRRERPPVWRTVVAVIVCLVIMLLALVSIRLLATAPR